MIEIKDKKDCCGCNACGDICPKDAISFVADEEGFLYPQINRKLCIGCGLCENVCPQLHIDALKTNEFNAPKCYAAVHKNLVVRFDSTSGGMFSALANVVYAKGGYVGGAIWTEDFEVRQYISDDKSDLPRLRSSKYAQSNSQGFYKAVKQALTTRKEVLVCGGPCQMAALRAFLGRSYDNLYIIDYICRGNNSPMVFRKYLDLKETEAGAKLVYIKSKNKELGWRNLTTKFVFANKKVIYETKSDSYFTKGYLSTNAFCRPSCYLCKFKGLPRIADITLADFWGADAMKLPNELDNNLGTSLVMVNNSRGNQLFEAAKSSLRYANISWEQAQQGNGMIHSSLPPPKCDRKDFFATIARNGFAGVIEKYIKNGTTQQCTAKSRFRKWVFRQLKVARFVRLSPGRWFRLFRYNSFMSIFLGRPLIFAASNVILECEGRVELGGDLYLGSSYFKRPTRTTALAIRKGAVLKTHGVWGLSDGADVELFANSVLECGGGGGFNKGVTIICAEKIVIGKNVMGGRHVTIRDNNGGHYMNLPGYKNSKPVEIGEHAWLCEGCTIMSGAKIGSGAVVGAKAVVFGKIPANTMANGNPAEVTCEAIEWKY